MEKVTLLGALLGYAFLSLAARSFRRRRSWHGAVRLQAQVIDVRYREAWRRGDIIEDDRSATEITLRFIWEGREFIRRREYARIIGTPVRGQKIPVYFNRRDETWAPRREVRSYWGLLFALGVLCLLIAAAFQADGRGILADLSTFRVGAPNLPGSVFSALIGIVLAVCTYACVRGLLLHCFRPIMDPVRWAVGYASGSLEEIDALCEGIIRQEGGDDINYYPLFSCAEGGERVRWYSPKPVSRKKYQAGSEYSLYRDRRTGTYRLKPAMSEVLCMPFALVPLGFLLSFTLALAASSVGMFYGAVAGFLPA